MVERASKAIILKIQCSTIEQQITIVAKAPKSITKEYTTNSSTADHYVSVVAKPSKGVIIRVQYRTMALADYSGSESFKNNHPESTVLQYVFWTFNNCG